jgi:hypothetical protein
MTELRKRKMVDGGRQKMTVERREKWQRGR